jgi:hypothetical protein
MGVAQASGDVEAEVRRVLDDILTNPNEFNTTLLERLFQQDGLEDRVQLLSNVLKQSRVPKLDAVQRSIRADFLDTSSKTLPVLESAHKVGVRQFDDG